MISSRLNWAGSVADAFHAVFIRAPVVERVGVNPVVAVVETGPRQVFPPLRGDVPQDRAQVELVRLRVVRDVALPQDRNPGTFITAQSRIGLALSHSALGRDQQARSEIAKLVDGQQVETLRLNNNKGKLRWFGIEDPEVDSN